MNQPFTEAVQEICSIVLSEWDLEEHEREYLSSADRLRESEEADPCVQRFVDYEFEPPSKGDGVGRGPGAYGPPLAKVLGDQLAAGDESTRDDLRASVTTSIAAGYVGFAWWQAEGSPPPPEPGADPRLLWERWMLLLASDSLDKALPEKPQKFVLELSESIFRKTGERHGVHKLSQRARVRELGVLYGKAGATLRVFQSTTEFDVKPHRSQRKAISRWPY